MFDCTGLDKTVEGLAGCLTKKLKERLAEKGTSQLQTKTLKRTTETKQIVGRPKRYNNINIRKSSVFKHGTFPLFYIMHV